MLDLSGNPDLAWLSRLIADVRAAVPNAKFLIAGATARDLHLKFGYGINTGRATEDVDLAFLVENWDEYSRTRQSLLDSGRFTAEANGLQRVRHIGVGQTRVDLIPFAGVEDRERRIAWPPDGATVMNVIGFLEAFNSSTIVVLREGQQVPIVSLPALILLKFSAWKDRRATVPGKDAHDIRLLLHHYLDAGNEERLYIDAAHLLDDTAFEYEKAGARLLGIDARKVLASGQSPAKATEFFLSLVRGEVDAAEDSLLLGDMRTLDPRIELGLLQSFFGGLRAAVA